MLKTRIYTVLVLLPVFLAGLFFASTWAWALLLTVLVLIGAWEWAGLAGWRPQQRIAYASGIGVACAVLWYLVVETGALSGTASRVILGISLLFWLMIVPMWLGQAWRVRGPLTMAFVGAVVLLPTWLALMQLHVRPAMLLMLMVIVWLSDTAAYFCGKRWGRRKLAASISPGKTWAGVYGALAAVTLYYCVLGAGGWTGHGLLQGIIGLGVFVLLTILGMEGDLFESWVKRTAGVKDSGTVFPGHGGVLDRIDALTASMPAAALLLNGMA